MKQHFSELDQNPTVASTYNTENISLVNELLSKKKVPPPTIRPSLYGRITPNEKYMLRMRALAHDSVPQT